MTRFLTAAVAGVAMMGAVAASTSLASAASGLERQQGSLLTVNSTGWASRVNKDRYRYGYGYPDAGPGYFDDGGDRDDYGYGYRRHVRAAPYGYGYEQDDGAY